MTSSIPIMQRRTLLISLIFIIQLIFVRNFIQNQCNLFKGHDQSTSIVGAPSTSNSSPHNTHLDKLMLSSSLSTVPKEGISNILTTTQTSPPFHIFVYRIDIDKYISKRILENGIYEGGTTRLVESLLPIKHGDYNHYKETNNTAAKGVSVEESCNIDLVLDLGSNLGYYSLLAASRGYNVISFEASPDTAWLQKSSAALNGWLVDSSYYTSMQDNMSSRSRCANNKHNKEGSLLLFPIGVSDIPSTGRMSRHSSSPGMTSFATSNNTTTNQFHLQPGINGSALDADIELVRADDVLSELGLGIEDTTTTTNNDNNNNNKKPKVKYRLLKIDVEGYEMKALQGLNLQNYPFESIVMEYFPAMLISAGLDQPMDLLEYISSFGYEFYIIESSNGSVKKVSLDDSLFSNSWVRNDHVNLLAKKKD